MFHLPARFPDSGLGNMLRPTASESEPLNNILNIPTVAFNLPVKFIPAQQFSSTGHLANTQLVQYPVVNQSLQHYLRV